MSVRQEVIPGLNTILANVPMIISKGADRFSSIGTEISKGTRIFSLVGKPGRNGATIRNRPLCRKEERRKK